MNTVSKTIYLVLLCGVFIVTTGLLGFDCNNSGKEEGVFFRSQDGGKSYSLQSAMADPENKQDISRIDILDIAVDPAEPKNVYLGTRGKSLYRSSNHGETWTKLKDESNNMTEEANIYDIAISSQDPKVMYAAIFQDGRGRLHKSTTRGQSWQETYIVTDENYAVFSVALDPTNSDIVYIGTAQGGLLKSVDGGESWKVLKWVAEGILTTSSVINKIVVDPSNPTTVYASTDGDGIFKTIDAGESWSQLAEGFKGYTDIDEVTDFTIDPNNTAILYSASTRGVIKSADGGTTWSRLEIVVPEAAETVKDITVDPKNSNILYYGAGSVIYKSADGGSTWKVTDLPSSKKIRVIDVDPTDSTNIYVGTHKKD